MPAKKRHKHLNLTLQGPFSRKAFYIFNENAKNLTAACAFLKNMVLICI